ncbi:hypothetical protein LCGC14_3159940 [marine sediment metagenome]|uniref:Uncharacterized protein n=1 Tax=marine sediment metagenome TaxID=412755 RepID=A0A0F8VRJ3_9ZZZZ
MKLRTKIGLGIVALVVVLSLTIASISGGSSEDKSAINNTTVVEVAETSVVVPTEVPALPLMTREECNYLGRSDVVFSAITIVEQVGESFVAGGDYAVKATELLGEFTGTHTAGCAD